MNHRGAGWRGSEEFMLISAPALRTPHPSADPARHAWTAPEVGPGATPRRQHHEVL